MWVGPRSGLDGRGNSRPLPGFDPRTFQPVASRYTDWAIPAHDDDDEDEALQGVRWSEIVLSIRECRVRSTAFIKAFRDFTQSLQEHTAVHIKQG